MSCKHLYIGLDHGDVWFCNECRAPFAPVGYEIGILQKKADKYGLALMMIREGAENPAGFARRILAESIIRDEVSTVYNCPRCGAPTIPDDDHECEDLKAFAAMKKEPR